MIHMPKCGCPVCVAARFEKTLIATKYPTMTDVAAMLANPSAAGLRTRPGRTLPEGRQWAGHDVPGRGSAAKRRLRQMAKQAAKKKPDA